MFSKACAQKPLYSFFNAFLCTCVTLNKENLSRQEYIRKILDQFEEKERDARKKMQQKEKKGVVTKYDW